MNRNRHTGYDNVDTPFHFRDAELTRHLASFVKIVYIHAIRAATRTQMSARPFDYWTSVVMQLGITALRVYGNPLREEIKMVSSPQGSSRPTITRWPSSIYRLVEHIRSRLEAFLGSRRDALNLRSRHPGRFFHLHRTTCQGDHRRHWSGCFIWGQDVSCHLKP